MGYECFELSAADGVAHLSFAYLNALQPAIFDIEEIKRALKSAKR